MGAADKKTISSPANRARRARIERRLQALRAIQRYWSRKARQCGIRTEKDLARHLRA
jgi:hypothetical protein